MGKPVWFSPHASTSCCQTKPKPVAPPFGRGFGPAESDTAKDPPAKTWKETFTLTGRISTLDVFPYGSLLEVLDSGVLFKAFVDVSPY